MLGRKQLLINGEWRDADGRQDACRSSIRRPKRSSPRSASASRERRRRRGRGGARGARRAVGQDVGARARPADLEARRAADREDRRGGAARDAAQRQADHRIAAHRDPDGRRVPPVLRGLGGQDSRRDHSGEGQRARLHAARAARRRRRDRAVEFPAAPGDVESRAGAGGRQHGHPQAGQSDAADGARVRRRSRSRSGLPPGVLNVITGSGGDRRPGARRASRRRQDRVHRRHVDRPWRHANRGRDREAHHARARRQVAEHRVSRRRSRRGHPRRDRRHLLRQGRGLRRRIAAAGRSVDQGSVHRQGRRAHEEDGAGRSARSEDAAGRALVEGAARARARTTSRSRRKRAHRSSRAAPAPTSAPARATSCSRRCSPT